MEFETIPTVPTAEEVLDRSFRRAAEKKKLKTNKDKGNEEFVRAVASSVRDKLEGIVKTFPTFERLPPFYRDLADILFGVDRLRKSLGAVSWAAQQAYTVGGQHARAMQTARNTGEVRKQAVARIASIVHQVEDDLLFLNEARNILRKIPHISEEDFTVVVAGFPNVGKSSFIRLVSSAEPEVARYPFTTKGVIVGHRELGRERMQLVDTPGVLERPAEERNVIEQQAVSALVNTADVVLFVLDASEQCGYAMQDQQALLAEVREMVDVPIVPVVNKADICGAEGYLTMSTVTGEGIEEVLETLLRYRSTKVRSPPEDTPAENR